MGFKDKAYELNLLVVLLLQIELQILKDFPTCFVHVFHYVSFTIKIIII
jgi:hypothetical protein